jgi:shikimate dehydrogenase
MEAHRTLRAAAEGYSPAAVKRFAVIGDPIAHSASPRLFRWLADRLGLALTYEAVRVPSGSLASVLEEARGGRWDGLSVTIPHKRDALVLADRPDPRATRTGAANCLVRAADGRLVAHNTDVEGVTAALASHGRSLTGSAVLLLGAGGAARAGALAAREAGAARLWIANRRPKRALELASAFDGEALPLTVDALGPVLPQTDLVLQATPVGLDASEDSPLPPGCVLHDRLTVMDMVYRPLRTRLLRDAEAAGARNIDGLWMLVFQGLAALRLWTGIEPGADVAPALHAHLAEDG